jgi:ABC-type antimicrobial peptide transport system permease subunit
MVVRDALVLVGVGLAAGVPAALWGREAAVYLMADIPVKNVGPIVFGSVGMVFVGLGAAYWPARRAARVDPMVALRH